jgi:hypothetical protein
MAMKRLIIINLSIILVLGLALLVSCNRGEYRAGEDKKALAHAAMQEFIDVKLGENSNVYRIEDLEGVYDYLHEGVNFKDGMYVSCADVKVGEDIYDIDYYVKEENGKFTVVKEVLHKIKGKKVNRLLWEKK